MNESAVTTDPAFMNAMRPVVFRAYKVDGEFFDSPRTISEIESHISSLGRRIFIERARINGAIVDDPEGTVKVSKGDELVLSGRREFVIQDESWIGPEISDGELLSFAVEKIPVMLVSRTLMEKPSMTSVRCLK